jgi:hypothetical protein
MFFVCTLFNTASSAAPQITVSEDSGIEPSTVATFAIAVRRSNHSVKSHRSNHSVKSHPPVHTCFVI